MYSALKLFSLFILSLFFCSSKLFSQQTKADSLLSVINNSKEDSNKVNTLNLLAWEMVITTGDYEKTEMYANQAIELSKNIGYKKGQAKALNIMGAAYMFQGNYPEAINKFENSLEIREIMGDKKGIASAYSNIGLVYMYQGNYFKSLKSHEASLAIEEDLGDKAGIAGSFNNIGIVYKELGNYPEALDNYLASLKLKEEIGDKQGIANTLGNIGYIKEIQGNFSEALGYHLASLKIRQDLGDKRGISDSYSNIGNIYQVMHNYPQALKNHFASLKIFMEIGNKSGIAAAYNNIAQVYDSQGDAIFAGGNEQFALNVKYPESLKNHIASLEIRQEIGDKQGIAGSYLGIGAISIKLKNYKEAIKYLNDGLVVSKEIGSKKIIQDCYYKLSLLDSLQGDILNAYSNYRMYIVYRDSLFNEENAEKALQAQIRYNFEKDELIAQQEEEKRLQRIARRNTLQYAFIVVAVLIVLGIVLLFGFIKVPPQLAQGLNFVLLLMVFETVLVFLDPYLDIFAQGIPIRKLIVNILLAVLIFPLHNFLERRLKKTLKLK